MADRIVLCMKYGTLYPVDYVNVLYNATRRAMREPFRFVCLTDRPEGLIDGIEPMTIPDIGLEPAEWRVGGVWPKISLYDSYFHGLTGRCLFIDLDMVILGGLDDFFDMPGAFIGIDAGPGWGRPGATQAPELCSALISFDIGALSHLADRFRADKNTIMGSFRTEQAYIEASLPDIRYWPEGWVISFKRSLRRPLGIDLFVPPKTPPASAKVLAFHGQPRPIELMGGGKRFWDRFPHMGNGAVPWMTDYWRKNGGRLF